MKEKDEYTNLADRQTGKAEKNNLRSFPLYSAGEDFYSIYQEDKVKDNVDITEISGIN